MKIISKYGIIVLKGGREMFNVKKTIRLMMKARGFTLDKLAKEYNNLTGADYTYGGMDYKINKEKIRVTEMQVVCDVLNYEFWLINRETKQRSMVIPVKETMRRIFESRGMSQDAVRRAYVERTGAKLGQTGFSAKIAKETLRVTELQVVADILNYDVVIINPSTGLEFNEQGDKPVELGRLL